MAVGTVVGDGIGVDVGIVVAVGSGSAVAEGGIGIAVTSSALEHAASRIKATAKNIDFGIFSFGEYGVGGLSPSSCDILMEGESVSILKANY